jgi:hypothetical protein
VSAELRAQLVDYISRETRFAPDWFIVSWRQWRASLR